MFSLSTLNQAIHIQVNKIDKPQNVLMVIMACFCIIFPLDISQLVFAVAGALVFSLMQSAHPKKTRTGLSCQQNCVTARSQHGIRNEKTRVGPHQRGASVLPRDEVKRISAAPVSAPKFHGSEWDTQIAELLQQIVPSADDDRIVSKLASYVKEVIKPLFQEVEVVGFTSGDLSRKKAFGVAVPDVDIVASINPVLLVEELTGRLGSFHGALDPKKLQKSAIRLCTDKLVSVSGFKFRRSAFRGEEPKVTLLVPASCGLGIEAIPINFSVNTVTPLHNAALLTECGQMDRRSRELILLVKRWAKDRGICHATDRKSVV